jgi:lipopolysaccharide/colanic/teichoic acid biosynthesis glycosyltransferase
MSHGSGPAAPKLCFDFVSSFIALIILMPFFLFIAICIKLTSKGSVFFRQKRIGRNGEDFTLLKFRTMREGEAGLNITKRGDKRITFLGKILRKTKIDELPQLINVLRGDMAIVGPRPEVREYVDLTNPLWQVILSVKPGITDPVSLKLRNEEELLAMSGNPIAFYLETLQNYKLEGYSEYVGNRSFSRDLKIIFDTLVSVAVPSLCPPPSLEEINKGWKKGETD